MADACVQGDLIALSTHIDVVFQIRLLRIAEDGTVSLAGAYDVDGEVTCMSLTSIHGEACVAAGILKDGTPLLALFPACEGQSDTVRIVQLSPGKGELSQLSAGHALTKLQDATSSPHGLEGQLGEQESETPGEALVGIIPVHHGSDTTSIILGRRDGEVLAVTLAASGEVQATRSERFGQTAANILSLDSAPLPNSILVCCDSKLYFMADFDAERGYFRTKHHIWTVDAGDPTKPSARVTSATIPWQRLPGQEDGTQLLLTAGARILLAELQYQPLPIQRSIRVGGTPVKLIYSHSLECLVVAVIVNSKPTLVFLDPDTGEDLSRPTDKNGEAVDFISGLGRSGDMIYGLTEWEYHKAGDKWFFILVSTREGRLIIVSTNPSMPNPDGTRGKIQFWTRHKKATRDNEPIHCVLGFDENVMYCAKSTLHWEVLDHEEKKLKEMKTFELNSRATTLRAVNGKVLALTARDSLEIIDYTAEGPVSDQMMLTHVDPISRSAVHFIEVGAAKGSTTTSMILLCDRACGAVGLWIPWQQPGKDCEVVFEAQLPSSVLKFRFGRTRPIWQRGKRCPQYGLIPSTLDAAEILGIGIDGSLQHFTFLGVEIWRVLRFIQNLAYYSSTLYPYTYDEPDPDDDPEPELDHSVGMHIDGDMLQRSLEKRALEQLFARPGHFARLVELLDELEGGKWTAAWKTDRPASRDELRAKYFRLLYDVIEYYVAPVF